MAAVVWEMDIRFWGRGVGLLEHVAQAFAEPRREDHGSAVSKIAGWKKAGTEIPELGNHAQALADSSSVY